MDGRAGQAGACVRLAHPESGQAASRSRDRRSAAGRLWAARPVVLVLASLIADGLAFGAKEACRAGAWNVGVEQYQAHCYTDIYPLYFAEGLSAGKVPYTGHHVEYPVIIGAVMQAAAWVVRSAANPYARGLAVFRRHGRRAGRLPRGRSARYRLLRRSLAPLDRAASRVLAGADPVGVH